MRGSLVVLALIVSGALRVARAQTPAPTDTAAKCVQRDRGTPTDNGDTTRADPTTRGNKYCAPPTIGHTSVSGSVFFDVDKDGLFGPDEVGIVSWQVQITGPMTMTTTTDENGGYSFAGLTPGTYTLCILPPMGWAQISPAKGPSCPTGIGYTIVAPSLSTDTVLTGINSGWISQ